MLCDSLDVATHEALLTSIALSLAFVASLYLPWCAGRRDDPNVVRARLLTLVAFAAGCEAYVRWRVPLAAAETAAHPVAGAVAALFITALLYLGHLLALDPSYLAHYREAWARRPTWLPARDYALAPVLEELVFRRHSLLIWQCMSTRARIVGPAAMFSLAHLHHARRGQMQGVVAQLVYTFVFGTYAAFLYTHTRSVMAPIAAHVLCNMLGLPDIPNILTHKRKKAILATYAAAVLCAAIFAKPLLLAITPTHSSLA